MNVVLVLNRTIPFIHDYTYLRPVHKHLLEEVIPERQLLTEHALADGVPR